MSLSGLGEQIRNRQCPSQIWAIQYDERAMDPTCPGANVSYPLKLLCGTNRALQRASDTIYSMTHTRARKHTPTIELHIDRLSRYTQPTKIQDQSHRSVCEEGLWEITGNSIITIWATLFLALLMHTLKLKKSQFFARSCIGDIARRWITVPRASSGTV